MLKYIVKLQFCFFENIVVYYNYKFKGGYKSMSKKYFGTDGIRGKAFEKLNSIPLAFNLGQAMQKNLIRNKSSSVKTPDNHQICFAMGLLMVQHLQVLMF